MRYAKTFFAALALALIAAAAVKPTPAAQDVSTSVRYPDGTTVTTWYPDGRVVQ